MKDMQRRRRYLATGQDISSGLAAIIRKVEPAKMQDGYWELPDGSVTRLRIVEGPRPVPAQACMTRKTGGGSERSVRHVPLASVEDAEELLGWCPYRLQKKRRTLADGWTVDCYRGSLSGIIIAEHEGIAPPEALPEWLGGAVDVTDSLTGLHLARLAHELAGRQERQPAVEAMHAASRLPRIVLTGARCSGKSKAMEAARRAFGHLLRCVPEAATIVIGQVGIKPSVGGEEGHLSFQRLNVLVQHAFEDASDTQARADGKSAILTDRGVGDIGACLPHGIQALEYLCRTTVVQEFARYDRVLMLDLPSQDVYERERHNNPNRRETYEQAQDLRLRTLKAWSGHPRFMFIGGTEFDSWEDKEAAVLAEIESFIRSVPRKP